MVRVSRGPGSLGGESWFYQEKTGAARGRYSLESAVVCAQEMLRFERSCKASQNARDEEGMRQIQTIAIISSLEMELFDDRVYWTISYTRRQTPPEFKLHTACVASVCKHWESLSSRRDEGLDKFFAKVNLCRLRLGVLWTCGSRVRVDKQHGKG